MHPDSEHPGRSALDSDGLNNSFPRAVVVRAIVGRARNSRDLVPIVLEGRVRVLARAATVRRRSARRA